MKKTYKIFISHAEEDQEYAKDLVNLLINLEIDKESIYSFSSPGMNTVAGEDFVEFLKDTLDNVEIIISLMSDNYYDSNFCMYELGATWVLGKVNIPILLPQYGSDNLDKLINRKHHLYINKDKDIDALYDKIVDCFDIDRNKLNQARYNSVKKDFLVNVKNYKSPLIKKVSNCKYKLVAFDLDGTLLRSKPNENEFEYSWKAIWTSLGADSKRRELFRKYISKDVIYEYEEWCYDCVKYFKSKNLSIENIKNITDKLELIHGFYETINILKKKGFKIALISGGINTFLYNKIDNYEEIFDKVYINDFKYKGNKLDSITPTRYDYTGKLDALNEMCHEYNIKISECVFIGDSDNDKDIMSSKCVSIVCPSRPGNGINNIADFTIEKDQPLCAILEHVLVSS
ncbi:MAG: haloacid dehalogenase-like hydrolase [Arcobacteraceae bacterium]|nr:haloacid dehalogenase-like hydrolase [Arcobacteraceae bacterium]